MQREESLQKLARAIQGELPVTELLPLLERFTPRQQDPAERELIARFPRFYMARGRKAVGR